MKTPTIIEAKESLDKLIQKSRVHLYKPIQIAEILYRHRVYKDINLSDLEDYRNPSKKWRDEICIPLLGRVCTSSAKFQDNLFEENAIPPAILEVLGRANLKTNGGVEAYIYNKFISKHRQLSNALDYCLKATPSTFSVKSFIDSFWAEPGLKRSLDKIYEIIVYSLFSILVNATNLKIEVYIDEKSLPLIKEFEEFSLKVMCLDVAHPKHIQAAAVYRVGVTNAADRGLDMYSNWGPAIQIKHLSLDLELAHNIVERVSSDRIIIVCKDAEKDIINSILHQIGWGKRVQSIVTESDLIVWYEKALRGKYSETLAQPLLDSLIEEISLEFPSVDETPDILKKRSYDKLNEKFW